MVDHDEVGLDDHDEEGLDDHGVQGWDAYDWDEGKADEEGRGRDVGSQSCTAPISRWRRTARAPTQILLKQM